MGIVCINSLSVLENIYIPEVVAILIESSLDTLIIEMMGVTEITRFPCQLHYN